jgi:hypothetical protein
VFYSGESMTVYKRLDNGSAYHFAKIKDHDKLPHLHTVEAEFIDRSDFEGSDSDVKEPVVLNSRTITPSKVTAELAHARLGHPSLEVLKRVGDATEGLQFNAKSDSIGKCDACLKGKFKKHHSRVPVPRPVSPFQELSAALSNILWNGYKRV